MMQVIILNSVPLCRTLVISPTPAYRNGRVIKVTHITMRNEVIRTLADPHTDGMRHDPAAALDNAVLHLNIPRTHRLGHDTGLTNADATYTQIKHACMFDATIPARVPKPERRRAYMLDRTVPKPDIPNRIQLNRSRIDVHRSLPRRQPRLWDFEFSVAEC